MASQKFCNTHLDWLERNNHAGHLLALSSVEDETGAIFPGLTIQLEVKRPIVVDRCLYELGLFWLESGVRRRVYQLNVSPIDKRSHNGLNKVIFGPHEHIGDTVSPVRMAGIECGGLTPAFELFCQRINLRFTGTLGSPL